MLRPPGLRSQRLLVGAAGMIVELFLASLALFLGNTGGPLSIATTSSLCPRFRRFCSMQTRCRFDGYYMLSDLLGS
jgi:hypothetical protein